MTAGPATGAHLLPVEELERFDLTLGSGGVVLGRDQAGQPVAVQLFRDRLTQVALLTSGYVARLLAVRALATGATLHVASSLPQRWQPVTGSAPPGRAMLVAPRAPVPGSSSAGSPLLRCDDIGPAAGPPLPDVGAAGAWQTRVVVQDHLPAISVPDLRGYDLLVLQRVRPDLLHPLQAALGLPQELADVLPVLPDDVIVLVTTGETGHATAVRLAPTEWETWLLGVPVRLDG